MGLNQHKAASKIYDGTKYPDEVLICLNLVVRQHKHTELKSGIFNVCISASRHFRFLLIS